jgi:hypothetical protein
MQQMGKKIKSSFVDKYNLSLRNNVEKKKSDSRVSGKKRRPKAIDEALDEEYETKKDADFINGIDKYLKEMPEAVQNAWKSVFPNNEFDFGSTFMSSYKNEDRIFLNWT